MYIGIDIGGTNTRIAGSPSLKNIKLAGETTIPTAKTFEVDNQKSKISKILKSFPNPNVYISELINDIGVYGAISLIKIN